MMARSSALGPRLEVKTEDVTRDGASLLLAFAGGHFPPAHFGWGGINSPVPSAMAHRVTFRLMRWAMCASVSGPEAGGAGTVLACDTQSGGEKARMGPK